MGLRAKLDIFKDWHLPKTTPLLNLRVDYEEVGTLFYSVAQEVAKEMCPVDTGFLRSSIHGKGDDFYGELSADAEYAQYVEYGTWKMNAQPYFTRGVEYGAQMAWVRAVQTYNEAVWTERVILAAMAEAAAEVKAREAREGEEDEEDLKGAAAMAGLTSFYYSGTNTGEDIIYGTAHTMQVGGLTFRRDGSLAAGYNSYLAQPGHWRSGTNMAKLAEYNLDHKEEWRQEAMRRFAHDDEIRARMMTEGSKSSDIDDLFRDAAIVRSLAPAGMISEPERFGVAVAEFIFADTVLTTGSVFTGIIAGLVGGALATILATMFEEVFMEGGPQFTMPEIEVF